MPPMAPHKENPMLLPDLPLKPVLLQPFAPAMISWKIHLTVLQIMEPKELPCLEKPLFFPPP